MNKFILVIFLPTVLGQVCKSTPEYKEFLTLDPADSENLKITINHRCYNTYEVTVPIIRDDYKYFEGFGAYKIHGDPKTFNEARKICNEEGAHLAVINSDDEEKILNDLFKENGEIKTSVYPKQVYIGLHSLFEENDWVAITDEPLDKINWSQTWEGGPQPSDPKNHKCASLLMEGGLDDVKCTTNFGFICEMPVHEVFSV